MKPLLVYARDPGAANLTLAAWTSVAERPRNALGRRLAGLLGWTEDTVGAVSVFAAGPAAGVWAAAGHEILPPDDCAGRLAAAAGLLTGLDDVDDPMPRALWRAARAARVRSLSICDNDVNLAIRLRDDGGEVAPDHIFALSEGGRAELLAAGIALENVEIVENPHLRLVSRRRTEVADRRVAMRAVWNVAPSEQVWLYAGIVRREFADLRPIGPEDEVDVIGQILARIARDRSNARLIVRPHPRDPDGKYAAVFPPDSHARESREGDAFDAIAGADIVVSLSPAMVETARILGTRVVDTKELL